MNTICKWVVCIGTLFIWTIKFYIRPFIAIPFHVQTFIDVAPNLIGCLLIPFAGFWWFKKTMSINTNKDVQKVCLLGLALVVINEYIQLIPLFKRTFDYMDIAFSCIGVIMGYTIFTTIKQHITATI